MLLWITYRDIEIILRVFVDILENDPTKFAQSDTHVVNISFEHGDSLE